VRICGLERTSKDTVNYLLKEMSTTLLLAHLNNADQNKFVEVLMDKISKDETYRKSILRPTILQFFSMKLGSKYLACLQACFAFRDPPTALHIPSPLQIVVPTPTIRPTYTKTPRSPSLSAPQLPIK
jgi:hypothetical protein